MTPKELPKLLNILRESSMISSTSGPWAWTQSSRSTPTSPMHNLSSTSRVRLSCSVEILSSEAPEEYDSWKLSGSHGLEKAYVQPIGASYKHIPQVSRVNITSSKVEQGWESRWYNLPKALCIQGKAHKVIEYEGQCRIKSIKGSVGP